MLFFVGKKQVLGNMDHYILRKMESCASDRQIQPLLLPCQYLEYSRYPRTVSAYPLCFITTDILLCFL